MSRVRTPSAPVVVAAGELELSGSVTEEVRGFVEKPRFPDQLSHFQPSVVKPSVN